MPSVVRLTCSKTSMIFAACDVHVSSMLMMLRGFDDQSSTHMVKVLWFAGGLSQVRVFELARCHFS